MASGLTVRLDKGFSFDNVREAVKILEAKYDDLLEGNK